MARPKSSVLVSRHRVFAAAAAEFATHGYAGANVDRIARAARLNKAMIYYHFKSKAALHREILRDMFGAVRERVAAIATEAEARPHFPPIWLREIAEGAGHVDATTLGYVRDVLTALGGIIAEGFRMGRFEPAHPLLVQGGIIAPLMFFLATAPLRQKLGRAGIP